MDRTRMLAVVGNGLPELTTDEVAEAVGRAVAEAEAILVCGGLGGVMEAACRGCKEAGGTTVGILPGSDRAVANPFVDVPIATGMGEMRNALIVRASDAVIAVGGGFGTLSEIAFALKTSTPVFGLDSWDLEAARPGAGGIVPVADPAEAVALALAAVGPNRTRAD